MRLIISSPKAFPKIWLADQAVDFRKSIDGLSEIIISNFDLKPKEAIFIFYNRGKNKIKILVWHGNGFILIYKRLEQGRFKFQKTTQLSSLDEKQLSWLLAGLDWFSMSYWHELEFDDSF